MKDTKLPVMTAILLLLTVSLAAQQPANTRQTAAANAAAFETFQQRLNTYLDLRKELAERMKPLAPTSSALELTTRQHALAKGLREARAGAKPGDLVPAPVAEQIAAAIADDFKRRSAAAERATFSEVPNAPRPVINQTYPADAALPTMPPLLLMNLPPLPDNLQYRFYGRHLLLIDGDVQIIADYIANVLPPH